MASKVIALRGTPMVDEQFDASEAITPGHLIELFDVSGVGEWRKHGTAADNTAKAFALERDELGKEITVAYAINDKVKAGFFAPGMMVNALIASGQNLNVGDFLESALSACTTMSPTMATTGTTM